MWPAPNGAGHIALSASNLACDPEDHHNEDDHQDYRRTPDDHLKDTPKQPEGHKKQDHPNPRISDNAPDPLHQSTNRTNRRLPT